MFKSSYIIIAICMGSFLVGYNVSSNSYQKKIDKIKLEHKDAQIMLLNNIEEINKSKSKLSNELKRIEEKSYAKIKEIENKNNDLISDIDDLNVRLYVYTKQDSDRKADLSKNRSSCALNGKTARVELDARTSKQIVEITAKADKYKTQLEELQNYILEYNKNISILNDKTIDKR